MAKLFKNAIISEEIVFLNQPIQAYVEPIEDHTYQLHELQLKEAYDQGYLSGKTAERQLIEEELGQLKQQLAEALIAIPQAVAQNRLDLSDEIAEIVLVISQQFFIENQHNAEALSQQINQILSQLNNKQTVELCLHPQEITALQNGVIQLDAAHLNGLKIKSDESLALGGYRIKTSHGLFDASIEKQIDKLKEVLLQLKKRGPHAPLD
ncbi:MAG: FliH/SctL family protein [Legionella sp.]|nr:FliH/SctL family protein [Legionella sp.]